MARSSRTLEGWIGAEQLGQIGWWRRKTFVAIGKDVARHLKDDLDRTARSAIADRGRTAFWRLSGRVDDIVLRPDPERVASWLRSRTAARESDDAWASRLVRLIDAAAALERGHAAAACSSLEANGDCSGEEATALDAWTAILRSRAAIQHGVSDVLESLQLKWTGRTDPVGRAVRGRLLAAHALLGRDDDGRARLVRVSKSAAEFEHHGDLATAAVLLNVAGVLARRLEEFDTASEHHRRAIALSGLVGDYRTLEGAVFNLALCRRECRDHAGLEPDDVIHSLVDARRTICRHFGVGNDSADAEVHDARGAFEMSRLELADTYLRYAEQLLNKVVSDGDLQGT
jgi:hypothetical protein